MRRNGLRLLASAVIVILLLVMHFVTPSRGGLWLQTFYDSLHVPLFGIIAVCVLLVTPLHWSRRKRLLIVLGAVFTLSALSEIVQIPTARDASFDDLIADLLGAASFIAAAIVFSPSIAVPKGRGRYLIILAVVLVSWPLLPLAEISAAYLERNQTLPALVRFDSSFGRAFFRLQNADLRNIVRADGGSVSAEITLRSGPWPGIVFHDLWPNWEPYSTLVIDLENPESEPIPISIRVHDRTHINGDQPYNDRFSRSIELAPGRHVLQFALTDIQNAPADRQMNLAAIEGLVVFCNQREAGRQFVLHGMRLK